MKLLDLFAGIGGFSLAAHWMGWETVAFVEWDDFCQKVLTKNFPGIPIFGDIIEFNKQLQNGEIITDTDRARTHKEEKHTAEGGEYAQRTTERSREVGKGIRLPDIITGGFPCQPFSHAGKRKGTDDSRYLWPEMLTTIRILKPSFVVGENVAGLVSMENGKTLEGIFFDLEDEGYTVESFIIPACGVGAWHRRDRIWIVAYLHNTGNRTPGSRTNGNGQKENNGQERQPQPEFSGYCKDVPDTSSQGLQKSTRRKFNSVREKEGTLKGGKPGRTITKGWKYWAVEPELGGMVNGLPSELDGYWDKEPNIPRVATGIKDRVNRLKSLGNAVCPQVVFEIFKAIDET